MTIEGVFSACNMLAMAGWILLLAVPRRRMAMTIAGTVIPLAWPRSICVFALHARGSSGGFSSLAARRAAVRQSLAAAGRVGALPGVRSVHRRVGNARRDGARCVAATAGAVPHPDLHARSDRAALLPRGARSCAPAARWRGTRASGEG